MYSAFGETRNTPTAAAPHFKRNRKMAAVPAPFSVATSGALTLPLLKDTTRYNGLPKRYEDTKGAVVQNFTHRYIVGTYIAAQDTSF